MKLKDGQGNELKIGNAYQWSFAYPGPDVTILIVRNITESSIECYDPSFKMDVSVDVKKSKTLYRKLMSPWSEWELKLITDNGGNP